MRREKHSLSHYVLSTFNMGELIPVANFEVLPGDTIRMATSMLLRVSPLMTPVMHPINVRLHHWFVPYRLLWDGWEDFITGGQDGLGDGVGDLPHTAHANVVQDKSIADYMGVAYTGTALPSVSVSKLPIIAYNKIYNEFYRDQDLVPELDEEANIDIQKVAWEKDIFTAARPWTQKGPEVTLPIAGTAPIIGDPADQIPRFQRVTGGAGDGVSRYIGLKAGVTDVNSPGSTPVAAEPLAWLDPNLLADLELATSSTVNDVRLAFALQRYQEARAQYGSRYTEYLRYLGVRSSDARLQRPEYLGGGRATISFSEVLRTGDDPAAPDPEAPIGEMRGHGLSAMRSRRWTRFFEEHGIVITLASVRPRTMYVHGLAKHWSRKIKEDFWQRELEQIGQQEVFNREVMINHTNPQGVFGYNDRYAEYRHHQSYVTSDFRNIMADWHLGRGFSSDVALNQSFIECEPSKRIHADQTSDVLWGMFSHSIQARRMVGKRTIGRIF